MILDIDLQLLMRRLYVFAMTAENKLIFGANS